MRSETPKLAERRQVEQDRTSAYFKLKAIAADVRPHGLRSRLLDGRTDAPPLLRVWDPDGQAVGETLVCLRTGDGWELHAYPHGPVIASAADVERAGDAASLAAAAKVAERLDQ